MSEAQAGLEATTQELGSLLYPGKVVDCFKVIRFLGRGGMSEVYLARDLKLGRKVVLKVVHPESLGSQEAMERFLFEARTTAVFNHPHIVTIYAVGEDHGKPYVALEYLEGQTLRERMDEDRLGIAEALRMGLAIAEALKEAHRNGVLHRDLKPENVIIPRDGRLRVLDFGLAKIVAASPSGATEAPAAATDISADTVQMESRNLFQTRGRAVRGTPAYMSPEQWREDAPTEATDIWALGVLLHEMLTGQRPYTVTTFAALAQKVCSPDLTPLVLSPDAAPELAQLLQRCLAKDHRERPSAAEVVLALEEQLSRGRVLPSEERSPFRGLLPFTERHARFFFGRDAEVVAFLERLREQAVLPVVGPSGAGKTSFVQAGVLPRLREQGPWRLLRLRPGPQPFLALANRLLVGESRSVRSSAAPSPPGDADTARTPRPAEEEARLARELQETPSLLSLRLQQLAEEHHGRVLLLVDQVEELYTLVADEEVRRRFMEAICSAADDASEPVRVIFTLRDDFLGRVAEGARAREVLGRLTVVRSPGSEALGQILQRPVESVGYAYDDPALVAEMMQSVSDEPAALPLLQFATQLLWEHRDERRKLLLRAAYEKMGGVAGALAEHADGVLQALTVHQVRLARDLLLRLVTAEGTRRVVARDRALEGLGEEAAPVLDRLVSARLVSVRKGLRDDRAEAELELVHESLIRRWARLRRWLDESREELAMLGQVSQAAELWDQRGRREDELWKGDALREALHTLDRVAAPIPELVQRFLDAGVRRARRRVLRARAVVAGVIALLTAGLLFLAHEKRLADAQREEAQLRWAEAQLEGARAAEAQRELLEARAKLRGSLEARDSALGRALWRRLSDDPLLWRRKLADSVTEVAFSPDGQQVAAACLDRSVYLLDTRTMALRRVLQDPRDQIFAIAFSPDGRRLATGTRLGWLRLWDLERGTIESNLRAHESTVWSLTFTPAGDQLLSSSEDGTVRGWQVPSLAPGRVLRGHRAGVYDLALSPDGHHLVSGSFDQTVRIWDPASGALLRTIDGHRARIYDVAVSPDRKLVASAGADGVVQLFELARGTPVRALGGHQQRVLAVAFSPDGELLASASADRSIRLWRVATGAVLRVLTGHTDWVRHLAFSPDGTLLASGSPDKTVQLWAVDAGGSPRTPPGHADRVYAVAFSPDGQTLASGGADRTIRLWDTEGGERAALTGHTDWVRCLAWSPDGRRLASGSSDSGIRLWDLATGGVEQVLAGHQHRVHSVAFSPDGKLLASASADGSVRLWDPSGAVAPRVLAGHTSAVKEVRFSPDGKRLASSSEDRSVRLWDVASGAARGVLAGHQDAVTGIAFSPDGTALASCSHDHTLRLWDLSGRESRVLARDVDRLYAVAYSPDGKLLATAGAEGTLRVIEREGGRVLALRGHRGEVHGLAFSPDGKLLATASADGTVRTWSATGARPHWRTAALLGLSPGAAALCSHRGWTQLGAGAAKDAPLARAPASTPASAPSTAASPARTWRAAVLERSAGAAEHGPLLCLRTHAGHLEIWDRAHDQRLFEDAIAQLQEVVASAEGCFTLARGQVRLYRRWGSYREVQTEASALSPGPRGALVAARGKVIEVDAAGTPLATYPGAPGVRAVLLVGARLVLGFENGTLALGSTAAGAGATLVLRDGPSSAVTRLAPGPQGTLIVGYANGYLAMIGLADGARLDQTWLHGAVSALRVEGDRLLVASELGDQAALDLSAFQVDACALLRRVWGRVPVVWEAGQPVARRPPAAHRCAP